MYIGSTGVKGLHHLIFEVVDNSVDGAFRFCVQGYGDGFYLLYLTHRAASIRRFNPTEALAGHCSGIQVVMEEDGSCMVSDDGASFSRFLKAPTKTSL